MAGYAYPVGTVNSDTGTAKSVTVTIANAVAAQEVFVATQKTRLNSFLASNTLGTILPVELYVYRAVDEFPYFVGKSRVLKSKYLILPLVSGDNRADDTAVDPKANKIGIEIVLQIGDKLQAKCPVAGVMNVTANLTEGVK
jgi:hypothetical protein